MRMGVGALAFAALDAFGQNGAAEIVQDDQLKVGPNYKQAFKQA